MPCFFKNLTLLHHHTILIAIYNEMHNQSLQIESQTNFLSSPMSRNVPSKDKYFYKSWIVITFIAYSFLNVPQSTLHKMMKQGRISDRFIGRSVYLITAVISVVALNNQVQAIDPSSGGPRRPSLVVVASPNPNIMVSSHGSRRVPKQVGMVGGAIVNGKDQHQAGGYHHDHHHGFGGGGGSGAMGMGHGHGDSKYFQYAHNPHYDEYEFGYRRGNDYHTQERYEKYGPAWNFKTKVKYHDKHGHAYGEHYWDYNHAGSSHDDGHGHDGGGSSSDTVQSYQPSANDKKSSILAKRENRKREKSQHRSGESSNNGFMPNNMTNKFEDSQASPSRGSTHSMKRQSYYGDRESQSQIPKPSSSIPSLLLDPQSGQVIDEVTGKAYWLKPANPAQIPY